MLFRSFSGDVPDSPQVKRDDVQKWALGVLGEFFQVDMVRAAWSLLHSETEEPVWHGIAKTCCEYSFFYEDLAISRPHTTPEQLAENVEKRLAELERRWRRNSHEWLRWQALRVQWLHGPLRRDWVLEDVPYPAPRRFLQASWAGACRDLVRGDHAFFGNTSESAAARELNAEAPEWLRTGAWRSWLPR